MTEKNKVKIASLGGIEKIMRVISIHKWNLELQEKACSALSVLASNSGIFMFVDLICLFY